MSARKADDQKSTLSATSVKARSVAPSIMLHDFNGKKSKIIQTLKQVDDLRSGMVKLVVFQNLLSCLDVEVDEKEMEDCAKRCGLTYEGLTYIRYENVLRQMHYDNHTEKWSMTPPGLDLAGTLSVIEEKGRGGLRANALRQSHDVAK